MRLAASLTLIFAVIFGGCASSRPTRSHDAHSESIGQKAAATAMGMVGRPYKYGGESPAGFDCSGLVRYSYRSAGLNLPHGTQALGKLSSPVPSRKIRKGDLVFFTQLGKKASHVGIVVGGNRFVHAPSSGKKVRVDSLDDPYWKKHFDGARRL